MENKKQPLLSICIPIYNWADTLKICLESIIHQEWFNENDIEIVISDNASTDNIKEVLEIYKKKNPTIKYSRNHENLWYDRNLDNVLTNASWKFLWFMSCNDIFVDWALVFVMKVIENHPDVWYICVNTKWNKTKKKLTDKVTFLENWKKLFKEYWLVWWLISQNIINKNFLPHNRQQYYWNMWFHISIILEIIKDRKVILLRDEYINTQDNECRWAAWWQPLFAFIKLKNVLIHFKNSWYGTSINEYLRYHCVHLPHNILSAKAHWLKLDLVLIKLLLKEFSEYPFTLFIWFICFLVPNRLLIILKWVLIKLKFI